MSFGGCSAAPHAIGFIDAIRKALIDNITAHTYRFRLAVEVTRYRLVVRREECFYADLLAQGRFDPIARNAR